MRKNLMSSQYDFFPEIDPTKPAQKPERIPDDYDDFDCPVCGSQIVMHTTKSLVECALNEVQGGVTH